MPANASVVLRDLERQHRKLAKCRYIFIAETSRCGLGIFAARPFAAGSVIVADEDGDYYRWTVSAVEAQGLGLDLATHCFQVDHDRFVLPHGSIDDLINHACEPTAGIRLTPLGYRLIALQDIAAGAELTYDYSTYIASPERLRCHCGSPRCRGTIGPFAELPPELQRYYLERGVVGAFAAVPCRRGGVAAA